ncbi:MAG TPA: AAA family ATPase [Jatrophihabitantaceae bacterium]|jgi:chloramphenicol 3-O-phosphotransferase
MPEIYVLSGVQAAGKSTVADVLARRFERGVHVGGDAIRAMVVSGRSDMSPDPPEESLHQLMLRYRASIAVAQVYFDAGFDVVIEDVIIGEMLIAFLAAVPWPRIRLVMLCATPAEITRREELRAKDGYGGVWSVAALYRIFDEETPRLGLWLDSTGMTPDETTDAILAAGDATLVDVRAARKA